MLAAAAAVAGDEGDGSGDSLENFIGILSGAKLMMYSSFEFGFSM